MDETRESLGQLLAGARDRASLSKAAAARRLGVPWMTYDFWERGVWTPGPERAEDLAKFLGCPRPAVLATLGILRWDEAERLIEVNPGYRNSTLVAALATAS